MTFWIVYPVNVKKPCSTAKDRKYTKGALERWNGHDGVKKNSN